MPSYKPALQSALLTVLTLFGGMLAGVVLGNLVFESLPGHGVANPSAFHVTLAAIPAVTGLLAGSAGWGLAMGWLARAQNRRRMAVAGMLGFVPVTVFLAFALLRLEPIAVEKFGAQLPIHRVFTLFFVPTAFLIAGVSAWAIGRGLSDGALAASLLWRVGLAAALAFLAVNLAMEAAGWVVGAPRAAERSTMLTVMFAGDLGAALAGGAVLGWTLKATTRRRI
jgi:hypothetical protein